MVCEWKNCTWERYEFIVYRTNRICKLFRFYWKNVQNKRRVAFGEPQFSTPRSTIRFRKLKTRVQELQFSGKSLEHHFATRNKFIQCSESSLPYMRSGHNIIWGRTIYEVGPYMRSDHTWGPTIYEVGPYMRSGHIWDRTIYEVGPYMRSDHIWGRTIYEVGP